MKKDFKLNVPLRGFKKDTILSLDCNEQGLPWDSYWNRRVIDAKIDNCIELVEAPKKVKEGK